MTDPIIAALIAGGIAVTGWFVNRALNKPPKPADKDIVDFIAICFARPAFETQFAKEASEEDFNQAIEDTRTALRTGKLLDRRDRSVVLRESRPYHQLSQRSWRSEIRRVDSLLQKIQVEYAAAVEAKKIRVFQHNGASFMPERDKEVERRIDALRDGAVAAVASICNEAEVVFANARNG